MKFIYFVIQENAYENVVWEIAAILSQPPYVKNSHSLPSCWSGAVSSYDKCMLKLHIQYITGSQGISRHDIDIVLLWYVRYHSLTASTIQIMLIFHGSFCVCTQPIRDDVTMWRHHSLDGRIHKMIPPFSGQYFHYGTVFMMGVSSIYCAAVTWQAI